MTKIGYMQYVDSNKDTKGCDNKYCAAFCIPHIMLLILLKNIVGHIR
jgi:hypothetical protein